MEHPAVAFAAVDIGASSGRVILGRMHVGRMDVEVVHRFPNGVHQNDGALRWDLERLHAEVLDGLRLLGLRARERGWQVASIGIDTWAVDYGLHRDGVLLEAPRAYRDDRTATVIDRVHAAVGPEELYAGNGLQFLPFNTIYQLASEPSLEGLRALLIPDLLAYRLTGEMRTEETNASTTGLLDARSGEFSPGLLAALGIPADLFPPLISPGEAYGVLGGDLAVRTGLPEGTPVVAVGSHDTASAVAAVPADGHSPVTAYVSSGTWSLVGFELDAPVLADAAREANFTNERGVDSTVRFLRNVGGLWLLQECLRQWDAEGAGLPPLPGLLALAAELDRGGPQVDADSAEFLAPGRMPERIRAAAGRHGPDGAWVHRDPGADPVRIVRCILDSLASAYARTLRTATELTGLAPTVLHIVGGGSQNALLCRLTAEATGLPVLAGPVEATALGNLLVQARAAGAVAGGLHAMRDVVLASGDLVRYEPAGTD
ncbi:rhamnulokinase [Paeniglutamicibacter sp. R2-26]|uniref:rhamnulokinase n=1 Tax=Paeniglutamicibacter sp. R2-26 TaxID=3144417 RepID=UPI003EE55A88